MKEQVIDLQFLKRKRIEKSYSISRLSEELGYFSYMAYYRKETGERELSVEDIAKLSEILNEPIENFFILKITEMVI